MHNELLELIDFEIQQIDRLLGFHAELLQRARSRVPLSSTEITALGSVVHSFYNGLESILLTIAKQFDQRVPGGRQSHRDLLNQMQQATATRQPILTANTVEALSQFLGFRHFFRHSYSFYISWERLEPLVLSMPMVWQQAKAELNVFRSTLNNSRGS